ncbi:Angiotensin-converting enzyme [Nesidiocoris tenuis]|uniref:Angiotensin-converting enzyme n=1 Tax=Nesidiocoris tenuis TaxID=355587 RepID=A0ABN7AZ06_9HEMI|nr:Angiotensin-converting enzyme [Nesidiocoris tenuis]
MYIAIVLIIAASAHSLAANPVSISKWFDEMNKELGKIRQVSSEKSWNSMIGAEDTGPPAQNIVAVKTQWREDRCKEALSIPNDLMTTSQKRMVYLLCRGPRYTPQTASASFQLQNELGRLYETSRACLGDLGCLRAEPELDVLMRKTRDPNVRLAAWTGLRDAIGPPSQASFANLIKNENHAAAAAGYTDIGQCWREELETPDLEKVVDDLNKAVTPFYKLLHGFVRFHLSRYYGERLVQLNGTIPAHLLGNMWSNSWDSLLNLITPHDLGLDEAIRHKFPTVTAMLKTAESYYASLGFPLMSETFWSESSVTETNATDSTCHGTAADMFRPGDVRMLLCTHVDWEDFYIIHHEMGHLHYFMAYDRQPTIFKEGANSAFQETIGDTVMLSVASPSNLRRLGILTNITDEIDMTLLLKIALNKIPQLPYGLSLDKWRWDIMASKVYPNEYNELWWKYRANYQGIHSPVPRGAQHLDPMSKFHVADNTPYIRYFLSGFLQFQILDVLCENVIGKDEPLHHCDLHGNQEAGMRLRAFMEKGQSKLWSEALEEFSNGKYKTVTAEPLLRYFAPLTNYLANRMNHLEIPTGW